MARGRHRYTYNKSSDSTSNQWKNMSIQEKELYLKNARTKLEIQKEQIDSEKRRSLLLICLMGIIALVIVVALVVWLGPACVEGWKKGTEIGNELTDKLFGK